MTMQKVHYLPGIQKSKKERYSGCQSRFNGCFRAKERMYVLCKEEKYRKYSGFCEG